MKKILIIFLLVVILGGIGIYIFKDKLFDKGIPLVVTEEEKVNINKYYIYGTHLNMYGSLKLEDINVKDAKLVMYNGEYKDIKINYEINDDELSFYLSEEVNNGLYLDKLKLGEYPLFLDLSYINEDKEKKTEEKYIEKYYILKNNTDYKETEYYTVLNINYKIVINSNNSYETMMFNISNNNDTNIYDVVLDPGHGGMDGGAESLNGEYNENMFTMELALLVKEKLEDSGVKVKLTREEDTLTKNDLLEEYGTHGRAVVSSEVKAKYLFSIHFNSNNYSYVNGLEIYTANFINYDFAKDLASTIAESTGLNYSSGLTKRVYEGIYSHNFTEAEVQSSLERYKEKNYVAYDISTNSNYYYMIRETGGIVTGAYVDDRNSDILPNKYYNSNVGTEAYILEMGYITNENDLSNYIENKDVYAKAIADSIIKELNFEKK